jgi:cytochrome oxidase assembly protein ShyY1
MTWRTFFDAVIMAEVKRRLLRLSYRRVNATGRVVRGAAVVLARAVRGTEHGCVVLTPWERALSLSQEGT